MRCTTLSLLAPLLISFTFACSDDTVTPPGEPPTSASTVISSSGGLVSVTNDAGVAMRVTFPPGSVLTRTRVTLTAVAPPAGIRARFKIAPAGLHLTAPATFTMKLADGMTIRDGNVLSFVSGEAVTVPTTIDVTARTLTATLYHLGFNLEPPTSPPPGAAARVTGDGEFIDMHDFDCQLARDQFTDAVLRAQAFTGAFPPDLASPLILQHRAAVLACESADSVAGATAALQQYACSNINSAETQATTTPVESAADLERVLGALLAAEGIVQEVGAGCHYNSALADSTLNEFLDAYIDRINSPDFTRSFPDWDALWGELITCIKVKAFAQEFDVSEIEARIDNELFPALFARLREVASIACEEDENNSFYLDIVTGGHALNHPITAAPGLPDNIGISEDVIIDELHRCGSAVDAQARSVKNDVLGSVTVEFDQREGALRVTTPGRVVLINNANPFTCAGIVTRPPIRVYAEVPGQLPVVSVGTLSSSLTMDVAGTLALLPKENDKPPREFDIFLERDRSVCSIAATGTIELCRLHIDTSGFVGLMEGSWIGQCPDGGVSGSFACELHGDGSVTGTFAGGASGSISGSVSATGEFDASASGSAGSCAWTGYVSFAGGKLAASGQWNCGTSNCAGDFWGGTPSPGEGGD